MTIFQQANAALRARQHAKAVALYVKALQASPHLAQVITANMHLAQRCYRAERHAATHPRVIVCGWDLAHNAAARVVTLAQLYEPFARSAIIGFLFPERGRKPWAPIRDIPLPLYTAPIENDSQFIDRAVDLVLEHPCDLIHLSKPRLPNILVGLLYKRIWSAHVLVDIDDEELAFVAADAPLRLHDGTNHENLPGLNDLLGHTCTRLAVGFADAFDGITVANPALQQRYGGTIIRHARDERHFAPSAERRKLSRIKFSIAPEQKVVIFLGTVQPHKGLLETAEALASINRSDILFIIVGAFPREQQHLKTQLQAVVGVSVRFIDDQPFDQIPDVIACGDICVLMQDPESPAARFQTPAKISDALAMGLRVLAQPTPALEDLANLGAFTPVARTDLRTALFEALEKPIPTPIAHPAFLDVLSFAANQPVLKDLLHRQLQIQPYPTQALSPTFASLATLLNCPPWLKTLIKNQPGDRSGVSIIILTLNGANLLDRLLQTFFTTNTHHPVELIIIDHGSTDNTDTIIKRHQTKGDILYVKRNLNLSFSESCNDGAAMSHYPNLLFMNNDIVYTADAIPITLAKLNDTRIGAVGIRLDDDPATLPPNTQAGVQHLGIHFPWNADREYHSPAQIRRPPLVTDSPSCPSADPAPYIIEGSFHLAVTGAYLLCRKTDFQRLGGFCTDYTYGLEDVDFCLRVVRDLKKLVWCVTSVGLQHVEMATRSLVTRKTGTRFIENNHRIFRERWESFLKTNNRALPTERPHSPSLERLTCLENLDSLLNRITPVSSALLTHQILSEACHIVYATKPKISVIIPNWNRSQTLCKSVKSALDQSLAPHQVIVIDDGSTDDSIAILRSEFSQVIDSRTLLILTQDRGGVSKARNYGLKNSTGDFIAYLDSDNYWHNNHLLIVVAALLKRPAFSSAYSAQHYTNITKSITKNNFEPFERKRLLSANYIDLNCYVHKKHLVSQHGLFDERLTRLVDWDLILRYTSDQSCFGVPVVTVEYFLDNANLNNITFTEQIEPNADIIHVKYQAEYIQHKILSEEQIERKKERINHRNCKLNLPKQIVGASERWEAKHRLTLYVITRHSTINLSTYSDSHIDFVVVPRDPSHDSSFAGTDSLSPSAKEETFAFGSYWFPDLRQALPSPFQLEALALCTELTDIDIAIASQHLSTGKDVAVSCARNFMVLRENVIGTFLSGKLDMRGVRGKVLRIPHDAPQFIRTVNLEKLLGCELVLDPKNHFFVHAEDHNNLPSTVPIRSVTTNREVYADLRPTILVLPMKLAVGGVERNTIETIRSLNDLYRFVYITMEKIGEEQGSLSKQVTAAGAHLIDMAEITSHDNYFHFFSYIKKCYNPSLVWICNGSMWLCKNASRLRQLFEDIPIVDQQVYDTEVGWIQHYGDEGIRDFDRFIAINSRIFHRFVTDLNIPATAVDLIYPAFNGAHCLSLRRERANIPGLREEFSLPANKKLLAFVGRLVKQKQPLAFLDIARHRRSHADEHYVLVGGGEMANEVDNWLLQYDGSNITWIKYIEDVPNFFRCVDGLIITSLYEGLPIAMLEALAMGVPVFSTDVGDVRIVVEEHNAGFVVDYVSDPYRMSNDLDHWLQNIPEYRKALDCEAAKIIKRFSMSSIAKQYKACWSKAIHNMQH